MTAFADGGGDKYVDETESLCDFPFDKSRELW